MRRLTAALAALLAILAVPSLAQEGEAIALSLPVDCILGDDCLVQQLPDMEPGPATSDPFCGVATYDGHKGTDFALRFSDDIERGVAVLAPAPGRVAAVRDGEPDALGRGVPSNRECGNGVVIDHGGGWETQLCHLRKGSVRVSAGDAVARGDMLGEVGASGMAQFAHVHLSVRRDGEPIDPATGRTLDAGCAAEGGRPLWNAETAEAIGRPGTQLLGLGLADGPVDADALWAAGPPAAPDGSNPPVAVAWGAAVNLRAGDTIRVELLGPNGVLAENEATMDRTRARQMLFAGVRDPDGPLRARMVVERDGATVLEEVRGLED